MRTIAPTKSSRRRRVRRNRRRARSNKQEVVEGAEEEITKDDEQRQYNQELTAEQLLSANDASAKAARDLSLRGRMDRVLIAPTRTYNVFTTFLEPIQEIKEALTK